MTFCPPKNYSFILVTFRIFNIFFLESSMNPVNHWQTSRPVVFDVMYGSDQQEEPVSTNRTHGGSVLCTLVGRLMRPRNIENRCVHLIQPVITHTSTHVQHTHTHHFCTVAPPLVFTFHHLSSFHLSSSTPSRSPPSSYVALPLSLTVS